MAESQEEIPLRRPSSIRSFWYGFATAMLAVFLKVDLGRLPTGHFISDIETEDAVVLPCVFFLIILGIMLLFIIIVYGIPGWRYKGEPAKQEDRTDPLSGEREG